LAKNTGKRAPAPAAAPDTHAQQLAARGVLWLCAFLCAALALGGIWLLTLAFPSGVLLPLRAGLGLLSIAIGGAGCWAGLYAARHSRLVGGKLLFDQAARSLIAAPAFARSLKWGGHAAGITVLAMSWASYFYPAGIALP
jgi:hypothetical protein